MEALVAVVDVVADVADVDYVVAVVDVVLDDDAVVERAFVNHQE